MNPSCLVWFLEQAAPLLGDEKGPEFVERMIAGMRVTFGSRLSEAVCAMGGVNPSQG